MRPTLVVLLLLTGCNHPSGTCKPAPVRTVVRAEACPKQPAPDACVEEWYATTDTPACVGDWIARVADHRTTTAKPGRKK